MFNFEHRFEILTPISPWILAPRAATPVGARATETRPDPQRLAETVHGRGAVVTGGATGLGRATALEVAQRGTAGAPHHFYPAPPAGPGPGVAPRGAPP